MSCLQLNQNSTNMTKFRLFMLLNLFMSTAAIGQQQSGFHHLLTQKILDNAGFVLQRKFTVKDTVLIQKIVGVDTFKSVIIVDKPSKEIMIVGETLKCIIALEKTTPTLDIRQITRNTANLTSSTINSNTDYANSTFVLTDNRKKLGDSTKVLKVPFRAWTWSIGTTPVRFRGKTDSSTATVSTTLGLSISFGRTWGRTKFTSRTAINRSFTLAPFVGISTAELKKETVKTPKSWENNKTYTQTNATISYGLSGTIARNNFGLVFSLGFDNAIGSKSELWSYQNKLWFGVGINTNLGILK
jgi:hypothetical protein